ncbi:hypothetical protein ACOSP7_025425 [Xanthoceras sorbifolium]|uniref:Uncharacterized protein n=1 Tax=Xanthoceras sorbifolium TaxID=99658 RepID=A0ABQ8H6Y6_9ROSI|nr:hypothetical protein JRO89_XS13G0065900 [Xanthoceras sorbifolium]
MEAKDPFASISELCHVSSSQEDCLGRCRFAHEPDENDDQDDEEEDGSEASGEIPTGIIMVSPPDSSIADDVNDDSTPHDTDIFHTPPEVSLRDNRTDFLEEETAGGCANEEKAVDLGADTDLGFSEVESTQRIDCENEVINCELDTVRHLKRKLTTKDCSSDSQLKKPKTLDKNLGLDCSNQCVGAELGESRDQFHSNRVSTQNCGSKSLQIDQNSETFGESFTKTKRHFSTEVLELEAEASDGILGFSERLENNTINCEGCNNGRGEKTRNLGRKSIEDLDKYRYIGPSADSSHGMMRTQRMRTLPVSVCGQPENAQKELDSGKNHREITLLDVLKMLAEKCGCDRSVENKSILEVAKSRGMTFP